MSSVKKARATSCKCILVKHLCSHFLTTYSNSSFTIKFLPGSCTSTFKFKAQTAEECDKWVTSIQSHIEASDGHAKQALAPKDSGFWKQEQITEKQFILQAATFDVLLFKTNTTAAKLVRAATRSEYDHIALVIKMSSAPDEVFMYEATGGTGVNMARFSAKKIYIGSYYRKCVLRKLTWPDKDTNLPNLLEFCRQTEGHQYSMMSKFSMQQSVIKSGANSQQAIEEGRKFFCSELIAKCYKEC